MPDYKNLVTSASIFMLLLRIDKYIARMTAKARCPYCGGPLHVSNWIRAGFCILVFCNPEVFLRHSFCCAKCRVRVTPNSLRFMYYKRNAVIAELVLCALDPEENKEAQRELLKSLGIDRKTLNIFRKWWRLRFGKSLFAKRESSFIHGLDANNPAAAILAHFKSLWPHNLKKALTLALSFLAKYRTDRMRNLHKERGGRPLNVPKNISPFSMA